jgi:hypothetical protein
MMADLGVDQIETMARHPVEASAARINKKRGSDMDIAKSPA